MIFCLGIYQRSHDEQNLVLCIIIFVAFVGIGGIRQHALSSSRHFAYLKVSSVVLYVKRLKIMHGSVLTGTILSGGFEDS